MQLALLALISVAAAAQTAPLTLPAYDMYRYAVVGRAFSYTFVPGGGIAPYEFGVEEGSTLPPGLRLNTATGELSGAVSEAGEYRHFVCVADQTKAKICLPFLVIAVTHEGDTYQELTPARVTTDYQGFIVKPGEYAEVSYDPVSGRLPDGMVLETTGRLYGIPRAPGGAWAFRIRTRDASGTYHVLPFLLRVLGPLVASSKMPNAYSAVEYRQTISILGDKPPHVWTVRRGPLPSGFTISDNGILSGVSTQPGSYVFTLRATDSTSASQDRELTLIVEGRLPPLEVGNPVLPGAALGVPYSQQINISGGRAPYTFRILGSMPPGLTLSPAALLSGTPTAAGIYSFSLEITDVAGQTILKTISVTVGNLRYTGATSFSAYAQEELRVQLTAEGGSAPYRWQIAAGVPPAGITLADSGLLSGTPDAQGNSPLTLRLTDATGRSLDVPVSITVGAARPILSANGIVNGASYAASGITPGQIVTLFGQRLGPAALTPFVLDSNGRIPNALGGTRVLFDGQPAPLLYVSSGQIGAIVPYAAGGKPATAIVVEAAGVRSAAISAPLTAAAPGLFTADASGRGQAAALNQDGTVNHPQNPLRAGDIIVLFGTGEGQTIPAGQDGAITGSDNIPRPTLPVRVTIGGEAGSVLYAGSAPGLVAGVFQINVRVPAGLPAGTNVPVSLQVGDAISNPGVTLAIR
ncbi:MAG TPA: putative Ig domain-containing protein [Bryobacteraceae bacterium]|nr:putative Ig domain-containing protein [Bryobacteraceae bacterium]